MRWMTLCLALAATAGCGTICDTAVNAETDANKKGEPCGSSVHVNNASTCNSNVNKCSPDDINQIQLAAQCYENLAVCTDDTKVAWGLQALGCQAQTFGKVSAGCAAGFQ